MNLLSHLVSTLSLAAITLVAVTSQAQEQNADATSQSETIADDQDGESFEELQARKDDARARYQQAVAAYRDERYADAIKLFLEADAIAPSSALSFNIARAYEKIQDSSNALRWYRDYLRREPDAEDKAQVVALIEKYQKALSQRGVQQITVLSDPPGATVRIDGTPVGVTPYNGELPPGRHKVSLSLRGFADSERSVELQAEQALDLKIRLVPARTAPPAGEPQEAAAASPTPAPPAAGEITDVAPPPAEPRGIRPLTYITLGVGVAALGVGGYFEFARRGAEQDAEDESSQVGYADALHRMEQNQTLARIFVGAGGAVTLIGAVLLTLDLTSGPPTTALGVGCLKQDCWVSVRGTF